MGSCNLEWFLTQQQNTRQPSRSGLRTRQEIPSRNLLMSSQALKHSYQDIKQNHQQSNKAHKTHKRNATVSRIRRHMNPSPSEFGLLTKSRRPASSAKRQIISQSKAIELTKSQLCRKLHADLQEYAMQQIEQRTETKVATKIKLTISTMKQSDRLQSIAIKFWIIMVNLQYHDVKKLTQNVEERKLELQYEQFAKRDISVQHTSLPITLAIYERIVPLFMKALGAIGDPDFRAVAIPTDVDKQNKLIKRKQQALLLVGKVHFDKFLVDLVLMLGLNCLNLTASDLAFVYRKCYLGMTYRFTDDVQFIQEYQIESAFEIDAVLQARRGTGLMLGQPQQPIIIPSSINSEQDDKNVASRVQIMQSNESQPPQKNQQITDDNTKQSLAVLANKTQPRHSFNAGRRDQPLSAKNKLLTTSETRERRQKSFTNLSQGVKLGVPEQQTEYEAMLPIPPHATDSANLMPLKLPKGSVRRAHSIPKKNEIIKQSDRQSQGSQISSRRQNIQLSLPNEGSVSHVKKKSTDRDTDRKSIESVELFDEQSSPTDDIINSLANKNMSRGVLSISRAQNDPALGLFNFENIHQKRQEFKEELAEKIAFSQQRINSMTPFEVLINKHSCLEILKEAQEFLIDEEVRVAKTPAGYKRPKENKMNQRTVFSRHKNQPFQLSGIVGGGGEPTNFGNTQPMRFFDRQATQKFESDIETPGLKPVITIPLVQPHIPHMNFGDEARDQANVTDLIQVQGNQVGPQQGASPKLPPANPLRVSNDTTSRYSEESPYSNTPHSFVKVTKFFNKPIDSGFLRHKMEEEADQIFQSSQGNSSGLASDPSFRKENQRRSSLAHGYRKISPEYFLKPYQKKLRQMTHRLVQEQLVDIVFKQHLSKKTNQNRYEMDDEQHAYNLVAAKLDNRQIERQQAQALNQLQHNKQHMQQVKHVTTQNEISFIQEQKSLEEQLQTPHATTSQEDSQFVTQEPIMTRPKFNQDIPQDFLEGFEIAGLNSGEKKHNRSLSQNATPLKGQNTSKEIASTLQKSNVKETTGGKLSALKTGLRRLVYGLSKNKKLSPIYQNLDNERSPMFVQSVDKGHIAEMEGRDVSSPAKMMANAKSGRDTANVSRISVSQIPKPPTMTKTSVPVTFPMSQDSSTNVMKFADQRKSYVTANLSANGDKELDSEEEIKMEDDVQAGSARGQRKQSSEVSSHLKTPYGRHKSNTGLLRTSTGVIADSNTSQQQLSTNSQATKANIIIRPAHSQALAKSSIAQTSISNNELASIIGGALNLSTQEYQHKSMASIGVGKNSQDSRANEKNGLLNINVNSTVNRKSGARRNSQISVISISQRERQKSVNHDQKIQNMVKKQKMVFPFSQSSNQIKQLHKRGHSNPIDMRVGSQLALNQEDEGKKIKDGLFALRRANKNRRQQLQKATQGKRERIINSQIPGVDYSRQIRQFKANFGQIFDKEGNRLAAIDEAMLSAQQNGATLLISEELMAKMHEDGFLQFDTGKANRQANKMIKAAATDPQLVTSLSSSFQLAATPLASQIMPGGFNGTPNFEPSSHQQIRPESQGVVERQHKKELFMATEDYSMSDPAKSPNTVTQIRKNSSIPSRMTVDESSREIVVQANKHQQSQRPYQMVIRQQVSSTMMTGAAVQSIGGDVSTQNVEETQSVTAPSPKLKQRQTTMQQTGVSGEGNFLAKLNLAQIDDDQAEEEVEGAQVPQKGQQQLRAPSKSMNLGHGATQAQRLFSRGRDQMVLVEDESNLGDNSSNCSPPFARSRGRNLTVTQNPSQQQ